MFKFRKDTAERAGILRPFKSVAQRLLFTAERFADHEMANHAAAGAYGFLLSATPAILLVLGLARAIFRSFPLAISSVESLAAQFLGPLASAKAVESFFKEGLGNFAIIFGVVSLVWAARLFIVTVQRALRLIYSAAGRNTPVKENILTFAVEIAFLMAFVIVFAASQISLLLVEQAETAMAAPFASGLKTLIGASPAVVLFIFAYLTLMLIPPVKPRRKTAALSSAICVILYAIIAFAMDLFTNGARYELLYGVFGSLIVLLLKVYVFFTLYLYCAEFAYVVDHFDALLFGRFYRIARKGGAGRFERALFMAPERLLESYARHYATGQTVFREGSSGREVYFIYAGEMGIFVSDTSGGASGDRKVANLPAGEVFGEMAAFLDEPRTATVKALRDSVLLELPPAIFTLFLRSDAEASRRLIDSLSARIKDANRQIAERGVSPKTADPEKKAGPLDRLVKRVKKRKK